VLVCSANLLCFAAILGIYTGKRQLMRNKTQQMSETGSQCSQMCQPGIAGSAESTTEDT